MTEIEEAGASEGKLAAGSLRPRLVVFVAGLDVKYDEIGMAKFLDW